LKERLHQQKGEEKRAAAAKAAKLGFRIKSPILVPASSSPLLLVSERISVIHSHSISEEKQPAVSQIAELSGCPACVGGARDFSLSRNTSLQQYSSTNGNQLPVRGPSIENLHRAGPANQLASSFSSATCTTPCFLLPIKSKVVASAMRKTTTPSPFMMESSLEEWFSEKQMGTNFNKNTDLVFHEQAYRVRCDQDDKDQVQLFDRAFFSVLGSESVLVAADDTLLFDQGKLDVAVFEQV
jgi:hypothetical protein